MTEEYSDPLPFWWHSPHPWHSANLGMMGLERALAAWIARQEGRIQGARCENCAMHNPKDARLKRGKDTARFRVWLRDSLLTCQRCGHSWPARGDETPERPQARRRGVFLTQQAGLR